jgi:hypothetical protein
MAVEVVFPDDRRSGEVGLPYESAVGHHNPFAIDANAIAELSSTWVDPNAATWCEEIGKPISSKVGNRDLHAPALLVVAPPMVAMTIAITNRFFMMIPLLDKRYFHEFRTYISLSPKSLTHYVSLFTGCANSVHAVVPTLLFGIRSDRKRRNSESLLRCAGD